MVLPYWFWVVSVEIGGLRHETTVVARSRAEAKRLVADCLGRGTFVGDPVPRSRIDHEAATAVFRG